jgi:outer membrane receptor protein involved in Fe transport
MRLIHLIYTVLFFFVIFIPADAICQDEEYIVIYQADSLKVTAKRPDPVAKLSEIAMKIPLAIHKTPVSVGVVTQKVLQDQHAMILSDALKNVSSINVQSSMGTHDYFLIRGFESTSAGMVLTDGADEPDVSMFRFFSFGYYDLYNIEQVEVLKGPAAFLYGANTIAGAVNLVRKQPRFNNFVDYTATLGSFNDHRNTIDLGTTNGKKISHFV